MTRFRNIVWILVCTPYWQPLTSAFSMQDAADIGQNCKETDRCCVRLLAGMVKVHMSFNQWNLHRTWKANSGCVQSAGCCCQCLLRASSIWSIPGWCTGLSNGAEYVHRYQQPTLSKPAQVHKMGVDWFGHHLNWFYALHPSLDDLHSQTKHAI